MENKKQTVSSSLQNYLVKGIGRGGGIAGSGQQCDSDQRLGNNNGVGSNTTTGFGQSIVRETGMDQEVSKEATSGKTERWKDTGTPGIVIIDGEMMDLYEEADEAVEGEDAQMKEGIRKSSSQNAESTDKTTGSKRVTSSLQGYLLKGAGRWEEVRIRQAGRIQTTRDVASCLNKPH